MTTFNDRERGEETKYSLDQQTMFKVTARRNKLLGLWAADLLGLAGDDAAAYAKEDVIHKVIADFDAKGVAKSREDIVAQLTALMPVAVEQVKSEA